MRRISFPVWALVMAGTFPASVPAAPRLVVDQPNWTFGSVTNSTRLDHDFVLRNAGDASLEIKTVTLSCDSCMTVVLDETTIPPGGRTVAHCSLDTRLLSGEVFRFITIHSNDPRPADWIVEVHASIVPVYALTPLEFSVGGAAGHRRSEVDIRPLLALNEPLSEVACDNTNLVAEVVEVRAGQYRVAVQALDSLPRGRSLFTVMVRSLNTNDTPCKIVGRIEYPRDYEVIPSRLAFEAKPEPQSRILWVRQYGEPTLVLRDAVPSSGEFQCEIEPDPMSADYRIYVEAGSLVAAKGRVRKITLQGVTSQNQEVAVDVEISVQ